jgi:ABC-type transport system involved in multi-copper enzyme maturation permease subunit
MAIAIQLVDWLRRAWPSSPILGKEMRISSRRRSSYLLRAAYLACLTLFVGVTWMGLIRDFADGGSSYVAAHMAQAGQRIVGVILWFQFAAAQVVALFMLGTAIPGEIVRGTMATLACTPLTPFQIVLGKLLSKMLQVVLLVAMSLPLLAVVRVFGGVPWGTVVAGLAVTLSSAFLVGAWAVMLSIRNRSMLRIVAITVFLYALLFGVLGLLFGMFGLLGSVAGPLAAMSWATGIGQSRMLWMPGYPTAVLIAGNCLGMIGLAFLMLRGAARRLREEIAIPTGASGKSRARAYVRPPLPAYLAHVYRPWPGTGPPPLPGARAPNRPLAVKGPALIWKDLRTFLPTTRAGAVTAGTLALMILVCSYTPLLSSRHDDYVVVHWLFIFLYLSVGSFLTVLASSTAITVEKESRALPILLTAPISDTQIIVSKATGVFYRALACWALLLLHLFVFTAAGQIDPLGAAGIVLVTAYLCVFLTGLGLYISSILRSSSNAMLWTLAVCVLLWVVLPVVAGSPRSTQATVDDVVYAFNPFTQVYTLCRGAIGESRGYYAAQIREYSWRQSTIAPGDGAVLLLLSLLGYAGTGLLLAQRARTMMRRRLFV